MQAYSRKSRENDPRALPDIEVFELTAAEVAERDEDAVYEYLKRFPLASWNSRDREKLLDAVVAERGITGGWHWQACFPGCLPDGDPVGPFRSAAEALADARAGMEDFEEEESK